MLRFWSRDQHIHIEDEVSRRLAALAKEINRCDFRQNRGRRDEIFDMTDLDELQCRQLWPETVTAR